MELFLTRNENQINISNCIGFHNEKSSEKGRKRGFGDCMVAISAVLDTLLMWCHVPSRCCHHGHHASLEKTKKLLLMKNWNFFFDAWKTQTKLKSSVPSPSRIHEFAKVLGFLFEFTILLLFIANKVKLNSTSEKHKSNWKKTFFSEEPNENFFLFLWTFHFNFLMSDAWGWRGVGEEGKGKEIFLSFDFLLFLWGINFYGFDWLID